VHKFGDSLSVDQAMRWAIELAKLGTGRVAPNPLVGCVILDKNSKVIGFGHHANVGGDHAEPAALKTIKDKEALKGATVVVTLEPCAHHGRTPPCAEALAGLPLGKVVFGLTDPNPKVSGQGEAVIKRAGIAVEKPSDPVLVTELEELAEIFLHNVRSKRAFIALKVAATLDAQMALRSGASQWITGEESRSFAHELRGAYDAVMVGKRTFLTDNPKLNNRHPAFKDRSHKVMVVDGKGEGLEGLEKSHLFASHSPENIIWIVNSDVQTSLPIRLWKVPATRAGVDLEALSAMALENGVTSLLVEGGPHLIAAWLEQKAAQRWYQFIAPDLIGAKEGLAINSLWGVNDLDHRLRLRNPRWRLYGRDALVTGRLPF
jgi:diaminohydroxyphosphoribosylaminopyrimidine deaminase/5-amino-6-(5-phosphoribosylamino)uracil reductase